MSRNELKLNYRQKDFWKLDRSQHSPGTYKTSPQNIISLGSGRRGHMIPLTGPCGCISEPMPQAPQSLLMSICQIFQRPPSPPSFQIPACSLYIDRAPPPPKQFLAVLLSPLFSLALSSLDSVVMSSVQSAFFSPALGYSRCLWISFLSYL